MDKIYILLPVHNRRDTTKKFIDCLKKQSYQNYHLLLIDDGSTDGTGEMVRSEVESLSIIRGKGNWWWGGSLHQGYKWLKSHQPSLDDLVLIINDDTEFEADFLEQGCLYLKGKEKVLLLAQCYGKQSNSLIDSGVYWDMKKWQFVNAETPEKINCLSTRGLFFRVRDFFEMGGFHPVLLPHYLSDYEFTIRANHKGYTLVTVPTVRLWTDERPSGYGDFAYKPYFHFLKKYFSKRNYSNPIYLSTFIWYACPEWRWRFILWCRVLHGAFRDLFYTPFENTLFAKFVRIIIKCIKTVIKKVKATFKLLKLLIFEPRRLKGLYSLRYGGYLLETGWFKAYSAKVPVDNQENMLPEYTYPFIDFLTARLKKGLSVFQIGDFNSTIFYSKAVNHVTMLYFSNKENTFDLKTLPANVTLLPQPSKKKLGYSEVVQFFKQEYDLIAIDKKQGFDFRIDSSGGLNESGVFIINNSQYLTCTETALFNASNFRRIDFWGLAPGKSDRRCTSVFYRSNNCLNI